MMNSMKKFFITSIFIENQSTSLIIKNLPFPPTFLIVVGTMTNSPMKHFPHSKYAVDIFSLLESSHSELSITLDDS